MTSEVETNIVAAERLKEYVDNPQEAKFNITETKPDKDWPQTGKIVFKQYSMRYRYTESRYFLCYDYTKNPVMLKIVFKQIKNLSFK